MKTILIIILTLWMFCACVYDTVYDCVMKNDTSDTVKINVFYDKYTLDSLYQGHEYITYLKNDAEQESGVSLNHFDTTNLIGFYILPPKSQYTLEHGMFGPDYSVYRNMIIVHNNKTTILHNKNEMEKAFKHYGGNYILTIE